MAPNLVYSQSTAEASTMPTEGHMMAPEPNTKATQSCESLLTLVMLNKLRCPAHFYFSANQITWSRLLIQVHIFNDKQCRSRSVGFFRSQLIWIYTAKAGYIRVQQELNNFYLWEEVLGLKEVLIMFSEVHSKKQCSCLLFPGCLIIKDYHSAGTELWLWLKLWELHKSLLCRVAQDWLKKNCSEAEFLYVHITMPHGQRLSHTNLAVFADTVVPSPYYGTTIGWLQDSIARASHSHVAFLRQSSCVLFPL